MGSKMSDEAPEVALLRELLQPHAWSAREQGWIRSVRMRQGLQGKALAEQMHVSPARISVLEKDELRGAVTLKMMQKAAEALDCRFVYALIPKDLPKQAKPRIRVDAAAMNRGNSRPLSGSPERAARPGGSKITPD